MQYLRFHLSHPQLGVERTRNEQSVHFPHHHHYYYHHYYYYYYYCYYYYYYYYY